MKTDAARAAAGRWATLAGALAACAPAWLILRYGVDVPYWDQWDIAPFFDKLARGALGASDLWAQQNEYRQFFPNLLFVALGRLTGWDVRYEMFAVLALAGLVAFNLQRLGARTVADPLRRGAQFFVACLLLFSPIQYENWLFGVQVVYLAPAVCFTAGLLAAYSERLGTRAGLLVCGCLAAVATFSSANGVVCWLALPVALLAARPEARSAARRWLPVWGACFALCVAAYAYGLRVPESRPDAAGALLSRPLDALVYFVALLGGPFALGPKALAAAVFVGAFALAAYALACARVLRFRGDGELVRRAGAWAALGAYTLCTAALVTAARLGYGVGQSLSSRYTSYTLYLLVALVYLLPLVAEDAARRGGLLAGRRDLLRRLGWAAVAFVTLAQAVAFVLVVRHGAGPTRRARLRAKTCLLFVEAVPEDGCVTELLYPRTDVLRERAAMLERLGYLRPPPSKDGRVATLAAAGGGCSEERGSFEHALLTGGEYVAGGEARVPRRGGEPADAVVLAYGRGEDDQTAFALAEVGARRGAGGDGDAWRKTLPAAALARAEGGRLTAWAFDAEAGKAYRLCGDGAPARPPR